jgi:hypothetical protein
LRNGRINEKISVHEPAGIGKKLLVSALVVFSFFATFFVGGQYFLVDAVQNGQLSYPVAIILFFVVLFIPVILLVFWSTFGRKTTATPIIVAGRAKPGFEFYWFGIVGALVGEKVGRSKFVLCEEGVVIAHSFGPILHRWEKIRSFSADQNTKQYTLRLGYLNRTMFRANKSFSEVERILSERIGNRD